MELITKEDREDIIGSLELLSTLFKTHVSKLQAKFERGKVLFGQRGMW